MTIGENIKLIRKERGFSQKKLAEKLETTPQSLYQWESNKRTPRPETLEKLASALDVSVDYIVFGPGTSEELSNNQLKAYAKFLNFRYSEGIEQAQTNSSMVRKSLLNSESMEIRLLEIFRKLNEEGQQKVMEYAADLENIIKYQG